MRFLTRFLTMFLVTWAAAAQHIPLETGLMLRKRVVVDAGFRALFDRFTTEKGIQSFFAPQGRVELAINGAYEIYFLPEEYEGARGNEGGKILSFIPGEMVSFSWNNPPNLKSIRNQFSWVVVLFTPLNEGQTQVDLIHLGFRAGPDWSSALIYFDRAWAVVLGRLAYSAVNGPIDWSKPFTLE